MRRALALCLLLASPASAQDGDELGVTASVPRPLASTGGEDPTASATELDATERPTALDTLADAVLEAPGARALRTGGFGSPTTLSLRGSEADQIEVLFGDVPIGTADGSPFDLSAIPLWALERVEIYRSGAPTWLARSGIGGVLRLVPREPGRGPTLGAAGGVGSYGLGHGRLLHAGSHEDASWIVAGGATTTQSDFPYTEDVTLLDGGGDAVERRRENAWRTEGAGLGHLALRLGDGVFSALVLGRGADGGVPGRAIAPTTAARRTEGEGIVGLSFRVCEGGRPDALALWRLGVSASVGLRRRALSDPHAEIGLVPVDADDLAVRTTARVAAAGRALDWLELTGVGLYAHDELAPSDALARTPNRGSARDAGDLALEARLFGAVDAVRMELRPSARLALVGSRLADLRADHLDAATESFAVAPTFRLAGAIEPVRGLTIAASAASATRVPNPVELFGDRGFLVGVASLAPERAETFDLGLALAGREGPVRGRAELRGFVTLASDLIRYRRNTLYQAVPENVASATLAGVELGATGELTRHVRLVTAWTLLGTWTDHGGRERRLPLRPWLTGYVRPEVRALGVGPLDVLAAFVDLEHVSESFWDPANTSALPERTRIGIGASVEVWGGRLRVDAVVRDVLDRRGFDLLGFPLPGRTLSVDLALRSD